MRILRVGESALLLEWDDAASVAAWHADLQRRRDRGEFAATEIVPAARTVLLDGLADPDAVAALVSGLPEPPPVTDESGPLVEVPTIYDGPDLAEVAALWGVDEAEVVARHTGTEFRVAFCGFAPGFGYLTGLEVTVPRRVEPRPVVPAGSVGLAGPYSGIYPSDAPGGWQLIGRTDLVMFDPHRDPPALLRPGTRVRFVAR